MLKRRWNENYVEYAFTKKVGKDETEKTQCILCDQILTNSSFKPSKLKIHFATHGGSAVCDTEALKEKRTRYDQKGTLPRLHKTSIIMQKPMLHASYRPAYLIAKSKKAHSIVEDLIKPCLVEVAEVMSGNEAASNLNKLSMSDNTIKRLIEDMSSDILAQIMHGVKNSTFPKALQLDKSTDIGCICQLLLFVRYVQKKKI